MSRVDEIEQAIEKLSPEEFRLVSQWVLEKDQEAWGAQIARDSASGALDFLFEEAEQEEREGKLRSWPSES